MKDQESWEKEFETLLEEEFVNPKIDSNGDLFLQAKYDDEDNSKKRLFTVVQKLLSSRDTYWKERVRKEVDKAKVCIHCKGKGTIDCTHCEPDTHDCSDCGGTGKRYFIDFEALDTLLDNLK